MFDPKAKNLQEEEDYQKVTVVIKSKGTRS